MNPPTVQTHPSWAAIDLDRLDGLVLVIGPPDAGKSTFARHLYTQLRTRGRYVAYLDGDPGQSSLGPPATITVAFPGGGEVAFPPAGPAWRRFVGSVSPAGHMLDLLVAAARLTARAFRSGAEVVIYDTTGLVETRQGGLALKLAKVDLLRPTWVFAFEFGEEMQAILEPLRRHRHLHLMEFPVVPAARRRDRAERRAYRAARYGAHFAGASALKMDWTRVAVVPAPRFSPQRLISLEDSAGFVLALGIVAAIASPREIVLHTPLASEEMVEVVRVGNVEVDPRTYEDRIIPGRP